MLEPATKQTLKKYYEEGNFDEAREAIAEICMELEASIDDEFFYQVLQNVPQMLLISIYTLKII